MILLAFLLAIDVPSTPRFERVVRESFVAAARDYVGTKYTLGGQIRRTGVDCSGLIAAAGRFEVVFEGHRWGIVVRRTTSRRIHQTYDAGPEPPRIGDLITFDYGRGIEHVAIYLGDGKILHAINKKHGVKISNLEPYWTDHRAGLRVLRVSCIYLGEIEND